MSAEPVRLKQPLTILISILLQLSIPLLSQSSILSTAKKNRAMVGFSNPFNSFRRGTNDSTDYNEYNDGASQYSARTTDKSQAYELSQMQSESSYTGAHSSIYRDPYGDSVPLTEASTQPVNNSYNPWVPGAQQLDPNSAAAAGITSPELPPPRVMMLKKVRVWPWFMIFISVIQIIVFIAELIIMGKYTGSPIATKPYFNPMLGPSSYVRE